NVFYRHYSNGASPGGIATVVIVACSIAVAWASWRWVETPFRRRQMARRSVLTAAATGLAIVLVAATSVAISGGARGRIPTAALAMSGLDVMWEWKCPEMAALGLPQWGNQSGTGTQCIIGANWGTARKHAVLWGDSLAEHILPELDIAAREEHM